MKQRQTTICFHVTPLNSPPIKTFPIKSPWVKLSGRPPITFNGHESSLGTRPAVAAACRHPKGGRGLLLSRLLLIMVIIHIIAIIVNVIVINTIIIVIVYIIAIDYGSRRRQATLRTRRVQIKAAACMYVCLRLAVWLRLTTFSASAQVARCAKNKCMSTHAYLPGLPYQPTAAPPQRRSADVWSAKRARWARCEENMHLLLYEEFIRLAQNTLTNITIA